jgi:hypothetical protein
MTDATQQQVQPPAPAAATQQPPASWYSSADPTIVGHLQNKGWDKLTPDQAALKAAQSHFEFEKLHGVPKEQLLRFPKDAADAEGWKNVYNRLGVPEKPDDYDFTTVKQADGQPVDKTFTDEVRALAHKLNLPKTTASLFAQELANRAEVESKNEQANYEAELAKEKATLKANWGQFATQNMIVAQDAARALGVTDADLAALEKGIGYSRVMEMFRNIGQKTGDDKFVRSDTPGSDGVMSREQALSKLDILAKDTNWYERFKAGDATTKREFDTLTAIAAGVPV